MTIFIIEKNLPQSMVVKETIVFSTHYEKLNYPIFPTIRGKSWYPVEPPPRKKFFMVKIKGVTKTFPAKLLYQTRLPIEEIPLEFIRWDIAPHSATDHADFVILLNKFRRFHKIPSTKTEVTVLIFEKKGEIGLEK